ncbi:MAG: hypothetical protein HY537_11015 [Deltaproteobacteria bacterium]|nr:hypothetical protein [Deltaproteobacteria bacterium]
MRLLLAVLTDRFRLRVTGLLALTLFLDSAQIKAEMPGTEVGNGLFSDRVGGVEIGNAHGDLVISHGGAYTFTEKELNNFDPDLTSALAPLKDVALRADLLQCPDIRSLNDLIKIGRSSGQPLVRVASLVGIKKESALENGQHSVQVWLFRERGLVVQLSVEGNAESIRALNSFVILK